MSEKLCSELLRLEVPDEVFESYGDQELLDFIVEIVNQNGIDACSVLFCGIVNECGTEETRPSTFGLTLEGWQQGIYDSTDTPVLYALGKYYSPTREIGSIALYDLAKLKMAENLESLYQHIYTDNVQDALLGIIRLHSTSR